MIKAKLYLAALTAFTLASCAPKSYSSMMHTPSTIEVDGKQNEWDKPLRYYDANSKLFYELRNNDENMFIAFVAKDAKTMMRVMQQGIILNIDTAQGKDDYPISIVFPKNEKPMPPKDFKAGEMPPKMEGINKRAMGSSKIQVCGFDGITSETLNNKENKYGLEAVFELEQNEIFCEMKIPFKSLYNRKLNATDSIKPLFFEVQLKAATQGIQLPIGAPEENDNMEHGEYQGGPPKGNMLGGGKMPSGPPPGGMGGGPGGGSPPMPSGNNQMDNKTSIFRFQLRPKM